MLILGLVELPFWLIGLAGLIGLIVLICLYTRHKQTFFQRHGIPSKPTTFLLGDLGEMDKLGSQYLTPESIKKYGRVFGIYLGNIPLLAIADADINQQIFVKEFSKFSDRPTMVALPKIWLSSLDNSKGDHWRFLRSTISPSFSTGKLKAMQPYFFKCIHTLHEIVDEKVKSNPEGFDMMPVLSGYTMDVICSLGFGLEVSAQTDNDQPLLQHVKKMMKGSMSGNPLLILQLFFPDLKDTWFGSMTASGVIPPKPYNYLKKLMQSTIDDRKSETLKHTDLLQNLVNANRTENYNKEANENETLTYDDFKKRGLTDEEVLINSVTFMLAGYETTYSLLSWVVYALATNPECQEKLIDEIDQNVGEEEPTYDNVFKLRYLDMVVNETLRMYTPVSSGLRENVEDVEIGGYLIPKGTSIMLLASVLHYSEEYWEEPNKFNPERFAPENQDKLHQYAYLPFSQGPRNCVGQRLAKLEVKATIVSLLQKYRIHATDSLTVPMPQTNGVLKPSKPLTVRLEKRSK